MAHSQELPNIIIIIMDAAGAKHCSAYGHFRDTTPGMQKIAAESVLYKHCFAPAPWTIPSHASLMSGLYSSEHGCDEKSIQLPDVFYTLAEILQGIGYRTVAVSCNGLVSMRRGFEVFYEMDSLIFSERYHEGRMYMKSLKKATDTASDRCKNIINYMKENNYYSYPLHNVFDRLYRKYLVDVFKKSYNATKRSIKIVKRLLQKYKNQKPLFIFMNLMDTHWQYNPPKNYHNIIKLDNKQMQELMTFDPFYYFIKGITDDWKEKLTLLYEQELYFLDDRLFDLYRSLDDIGVKDQTLFAITADHGEFLGEHDLWGHYFSLYNELVHIPLVVKYPASVGLKGDSANPVQLHDLYATIMDLAGVPIPPPESSKSMLSEVREFAFAEHLNPSLGIEACRRRADDFQVKAYMQPCRCIIDRDLHKLLQWADGRQELYDLKADYAEANDLISRAEQQGRAERLKQIMEENLGPFVGHDKNAGAEPDEHF